MDFLFSSFPPLHRESQYTFSEMFYNLMPRTTEIDIAVGYISSDSLVELQRIIECNPNLQRLNLVIGMHYFDKFTRSQYNTAKRLAYYLRECQKGDVRLVTTFQFHGKMYSYSDEQGPFAGIIGSNNLSDIIEGGSRIYESAVLLDDAESACKMKAFIEDLSERATESIVDLEITEFNEVNRVLEGQEGAKKLDSQQFAQYLSQRTGNTYEIPIKTTPKSNLNAFFGKGRESSRTGLVKPRHWYEVELIVPKVVTSQEGYPQSGTESAIFDVITDDGWTFTCKVSGDYSKNFRSEGDLKILGRWLKGRLENAGALNVGEQVTEETLHRYGRDTFSLTKIEGTNKWYIDFGV